MKFASARTNLNLDKIHRLHEPGAGREDAGVQASPCGGNDLSTTPVDGVSVKGHVVDVEANGTHVLVTKNTLESTKKYFFCYSFNGLVHTQKHTQQISKIKL